MFEDKTYENLLNDKLSRVRKDIDTREGSVVFDATAGNSLEEAQMYLTIAEYYQQTFGDTASREFLIRRAAERGIKPKAASVGVYKGIFNMDIPIGSRFSLDIYNYIVIKKLPTGTFEYMLECETYGEEPNGSVGDLVPIDYVPGLTSAKITEMLIPGEDEEETESIRQRYLDSFNLQAYGGNIKDYEEKTMAQAGVGVVKVTPVWKGGGTVRVTILDSEFNVASTSLISKIQEVLDPTKDQTGKGLAPIGHIVTVDTPAQEKIYIATKLTLKDLSVTNIKTDIDKALKAYLLELRKQFKASEKIVVRTSIIESRILALNSNIIDIQETKINGYTQNFTLDSFKVPVWGDGNYVQL